MPATDKFVVSSQNPQKLAWLLEMLRNLPEVEVEALPVVQPTDADAFWALEGIWAGRDIDLEKMRQDVFAHRASDAEASPTTIDVVAPSRKTTQPIPPNTLNDAA